jgi:hypothetical protein
VLFAALVFIPGGIGGVIKWTFIALLLGLYVTTPERAPGRAGISDVVRRHGENALLLVSLGAVMLALLGAVPSHLYPQGAASLLLYLPEADNTLVVLCLAWAGITLSNRRRLAWRHLPVLTRRRVMVRNGLTASTAVVVVALSVKLYQSGVTALHNRFGAAFFYMGSGDPNAPPPPDLPAWATLVRFAETPPFGNNIPAWFMAVVVAVVAFVVAWILRQITRRIEQALAQASTPRVS